MNTCEVSNSVVFKCLTGHILFLICVFFILVLYLYFYTLNHPQKIQDESWKLSFQKQGINPEDMSINDGVWFFKNKNTHVCAGRENETYLVSKCYAGLNATEKAKNLQSLDTQAVFVREALNNSGIHPHSPSIYNE